MAEIILTQGKVAIVDPEDFQYINQWKWHARESHGNWYTRRSGENVNGKRRTILMHRVIANTPEDLLTDHINGNSLDNRKVNLRTASASQNAMNRKVSSTNHLGIKGVRYEKYSYNSKTPRKNPYLATIKVKQKNIFLGAFETAKEATLAYKTASLKYFGQFGRVF